MKILNINQIKEADEFTIINEPISSIDLMERAAGNLAHWIKENISINKKIKIFSGTGNNGGDGLAIARLLANVDFNVEVYLLMISESLSKDVEENLNRLKEQSIVTINIIESHDILPDIDAEDIIIDAIFGSGLNRPLEDFASSIVNLLNSSRAKIIAIDIPSGLFAENNSNNNNNNNNNNNIINIININNIIIIEAEITLSLQFPKLSFFFADNYKYVGDWTVIPIGLHPDFIKSTKTDYTYNSIEEISSKIFLRKRFDHKGKFGHAFLIAGSYGKIGAAVLATKACLRAGVGLLTVHIPKFGYEIIQTTIPEAMTSIDKYDKVISKIPSVDNYSAVGIGPGIGKSHQVMLAMKELLEKISMPLVIDADGINLIAENRDFLSMIPPNSIITPHPKEFERLVGKSGSHYEQLQKQIKFAADHNIVVVLKGAFTSIVNPKGKCIFNTSGNPGMAKGGCGDLLTGIILALYAQGYTSFDAAYLGVYIHGLAADLAVKKYSEEALLSTDIINYIGEAFLELRRK